jgi:penicillin-binding protein 1A
MEKSPVNNTDKKAFKKYIKILWFIFIFPILSIFILFFFISEGYFGYMPSFPEMENPKNNQASEVISSDGIVLGNYFLENRSSVKFENLSPYLVKALIATEDVRFYSHSGVDIKAIARAVTGIGSKGGGSTISQQLAKMLFPRENFSNFFSKIIRKLREWVMAVKLEKRYTKEEIITMYFNKFDFLNLAVGVKSAARVYFNSEPDSLKIEQAAMLVGMAKNPSLYNPIRRPDLTMQRRNTVLGQMKKYDYITSNQYDSLKLLPLEIEFQRADHKEGIATYFREYLRIVMDAKEPIEDNYIDKQKYYEDSLNWETNPLYGWCNKNLKPDGTPYDIYKDGLKIYSTINYRMQKYAEYAMTRHLKEEIQPKFFKEQKGREKAPYAWNMSKDQIEEVMNQSVRRSERYRVLKSQGLSKEEIEKTFHQQTQMSVFSWKGDIDTIMTPWDSIKYYKYYLRAGLMSVDQQTGFVKAYVGGMNFKHFQYDMVESGKRQVGSTFKPFLYALAMQEGYSPCYEVPLIPVTFELPDGTSWTAKNSGTTKKDGQMVTLKWALANSVNYISAWLMKRYSPDAVINVARKMGVRSRIDAVPSICLGTPELSLAEMIGAFSTFSNRGIYTQPIFVTRITDKNGNVLSTFKPTRTEAFSEETSYLMIELLRGVVAFGTSWRVKGKYKIEGDIAAKTGTTQNNSDGWYVGLTPRLATGVWVGGEDRGVHFASTENGQGASMALPIWAYYMEKVYADKKLGYSTKETFDKPKSMKVNADCSKSKDEEQPGGDIIEGVDL